MTWRKKRNGRRASPQNAPNIECRINNNTTMTMASLETETMLSDYERSRAINIERNNDRLRMLGLISVAEETASNNAAWKRPVVVQAKVAVDNNNNNNNNDDDEYTESPSPGSAKKSRKRRKTNDKNESTTVPSLPSRQSSRLQGLQPNGRLSVRSSITVHNNAISKQQDRLERVRKCREARLRAAVCMAQLGAAQAAANNPTATYEHCLMRVRTMSAAQLTRRVAVIERAAGKHCVVKMAIFKSCLQDEGQWELAVTATAALERLKALQPPPTKE